MYEAVKMTVIKCKVSTYYVTNAQKEILKAFSMTAANIRSQAAALNEDLI